MGSSALLPDDPRKSCDAAMQAHYVIGGAKLVKKLPRGVHRGDNSKAFLGGGWLWDKGAGPDQRRAAHG